MLQVITLHEAHITVDNGKIVTAILDLKWDMIEQKMLEEESTLTQIEIIDLKKENKDVQGETAESGNSFLYVRVEVTNDGYDALYFDEGVFKVVTDKGTYYVHDFKDKPSGLDVSSTARFWIIFETPDNGKSKTLHYKPYSTEEHTLNIG